jgi:hypothetical protein
MPSLRKLSEAEIATLEQSAPGSRAHVAREYDEYLAGFAIGGYGHVELHDERRDVVRARLHAAARRRGLALRFRPGPGVAMIFYVVAAPVVAPVAAVDQRRDEVARREPTPQRSPRRRCTAAPRWPPAAALDA